MTIEQMQAAEKLQNEIKRTRQQFEFVQTELRDPQEAVELHIRQVCNGYAIIKLESDLKESILESTYDVLKAKLDKLEAEFANL